MYAVPYNLSQRYILNTYIRCIQTKHKIRQPNETKQNQANTFLIGLQCESTSTKTKLSSSLFNKFHTVLLMLCPLRVSFLLGHILWCICNFRNCVHVTGSNIKFELLILSKSIKSTVTQWVVACVDSF